MNQKNLSTYAVVFIAGIFTGFFGFYVYHNIGHTDLISGEISREGGYEFINPLLSCDISEDIPDEDYSKLSEVLASSISKKVREGKATRVSVYFRDMNHGGWTGVQPDGLFAPASLMKVPLLIAYLHDQKTNSNVLASSLYLKGPDRNTLEAIKPHNPLSLERSYSVDDLLRAMIVDSDNNAMNVLSTNVSQSAISDVYDDFGLNEVIEEDDNATSPKVYMRLFRILYNASYLSRANSQKALKLMSESTFNEGIVAGLPAGTVVSHKFGEREFSSAAGAAPYLAQLHDCGIVYYPKSPYGICIMTEGKKLEDLKGVIADISREVYENVDAGLLR